MDTHKSLKMLETSMNIGYQVMQVTLLATGIESLVYLMQSMPLMKQSILINIHMLKQSELMVNLQVLLLKTKLTVLQKLSIGL